LLGETVTIKNTEHPEGFALDQSFVINKRSESKTTTILDDGEYFVMGDNRPVSFDSRHWGGLPAENIVGRPILRLYPFNQIGLFPGDESE
ncbi:MAG: S26 family signal peptidase, partial [bacterium]|nr:S26 family signal peptidase [bacterium]